MKKYRVLPEIGHWKPLLSGKIPESLDEMLKGGVQSSKVKQLGDNGDHVPRRGEDLLEQRFPNFWPRLAQSALDMQLDLSRNVVENLAQGVV
jgi:hypothetical protein